MYTYDMCIYDICYRYIVHIYKHYMYTLYTYIYTNTTINIYIHTLYVANALSRHFNWSQNILFVEDLSAVDVKDVNAYCPTTTTTTSNNTNNTTTNSHNTRSHTNNTNSSSNISTEQNDNTDPNNNSNSTDSTDNQMAVQHLQIRHTILLSTGDSIVPVAAVLRYLQAKVKQGHTCFEIMTFEGTHGEVFLYPRWINVIISKVRMQCGLNNTTTSSANSTAASAGGSAAGSNANSTTITPIHSRSASSRGLANMD